MSWFNIIKETLDPNAPSRLIPKDRTNSRLIPKQKTLRDGEQQPPSMINLPDSAAMIAAKKELNRKKNIFSGSR